MIDRRMERRREYHRLDNAVETRALYTADLCRAVGLFVRARPGRCTRVVLRCVLMHDAGAVLLPAYAAAWWIVHTHHIRGYAMLNATLSSADFVPLPLRCRFGCVQRYAHCWWVLQHKEYALPTGIPLHLPFTTRPFTFLPRYGHAPICRAGLTRVTSAAPRRRYHAGGHWFRPASFVGISYTAHGEDACYHVAFTGYTCTLHALTGKAAVYSQIDECYAATDGRTRGAYAAALRAFNNMDIQDDVTPYFAFAGVTGALARAGRRTPFPLPAPPQFSYSAGCTHLTLPLMPLTLPVTLFTSPAWVTWNTHLHTGTTDYILDRATPHARPFCRCQQCAYTEDIPTHIPYHRVTYYWTFLLPACTDVSA